MKKLTIFKSVKTCILCLNNYAKNIDYGYSFEPANVYGNDECAKINFACMNRDVGLFAVAIFGEFSSFL